MVDWDELVRREGPTIWRTIYRLVHNQADADECLQETFVAAVRLSHHQSVGNWQALLKRLAVARAVDCIRQRLRRTSREDTTDIASVAAPTRAPYERAEAAELAGALRWALAQVPARSAEIFCLHELEGWSYQEIGDHFSMSSSAVGVQLHRLRRKLQKLLSSALERQA